MVKDTPRITARLRVKSLLLLNMLYKPSELSEELSMTKETIIRYTEKFELPFTKDTSGHIWINGKDFRIWAGKIKEDLKVKELAKTENDFHCIRCGFVTVATFERHTVNNPRGKTERHSAICPKCKNKLSKFARKVE